MRMGLGDVQSRRLDVPTGIIEQKNGAGHRMFLQAAGTSEICPARNLKQALAYPCGFCW